MTAQHDAIIAELCKALAQLGAGRQLLAVVASWGDTMTDDEVLEVLQKLNAGRRLFDEVSASTGGRALAATPQARRSTKRRGR
jgi:hypothetical protein